MKIQDKADFARGFVRRVKTMPREQLKQIITEEVGDELATFMLMHSIANGTLNQNQTTEESVAAAFMLGYLLKTFEQKPADGTFTQKAGRA